MICLQCGKPAPQTEIHDGIPIGTCEAGHRTGRALEGQYQDQEHLMRCGDCKQPFDMRNLSEVFWHETHTLPKPDFPEIYGVRVNE